MAKNLKDIEERNKRVIEVAEYVKETGASTRKTAKYFTMNKFSISNATVDDYLNNRLPKLNPVLYLEVMEVIKTNTPKTIEEVEVKKRIYLAASLLFKDYTIAEIAEELNSTPATIYNDLKVRLPRIEEKADVVKLVNDRIDVIDRSISEDINDIFNRHRLENLHNQAGNGPYFTSEYFEENNVNRREDGTFESFPSKK